MIIGLVSDLLLECKSKRIFGLSLGFPQLSGFSSPIHASQTHGKQAAHCFNKGFTLSTTAVKQSVYFNPTDTVLARL